MFETIVALATAPIKSALAIIRVSGDDSFSIVSKCCSRNLTTIKERCLLYAKIKDENRVVDEVILAIYKGPKSFTGEDSVEIMCHGSLLVANEIIQLLIAHGARLATRGEFSSRAYLHRKIDLIQAEAINDMINATTKEAKSLSLLSLSGETSKLILPIRDRIADILSLIEVNIDFPEYEDIETASKEKIISVINEITPEISKLISDGEKGKIIKEGLRVAIVGKPNVGKSSLLNALLGENKAIVTEIAGTTRDVVEGDINLDGVTLHLLDTAGIRNSKDTIEQIGITKSKNAIDNADIVLDVLDASRPLSEEDRDILSLVEGKTKIVILNKTDLPLAFPEPENSVKISAKTKDITALFKKIKDIIGLDEVNFKQPSLNNARQIGLLKQANNSLQAAGQDAADGLSVDLIAVSIKDAYLSILEILGEANQADLSKEIFKRFCVGK